MLSNKKLFDVFTEGLTEANAKQLNTDIFSDTKGNVSEKNQPTDTQRCFIATAIYGSYNCPQVWTLRHYRDDILAHAWYGRMFIRLYYAISPAIVKTFGKTAWFNKFFKKKLDTLIDILVFDWKFRPQFAVEQRKRVLLTRVNGKFKCSSV
jgi:hypothetical protein